MSISKVVSFLSSSGGITANSAERIRKASAEPVPLDQLVSQLRQMFTAPHERLCEARFDEMLDILGEQKAASEEEIDTLSRRLSAMGTRLEEDHHLLTEVFGEALAKARGELDEKIDQVAERLRSAIEDMNQKLRASLHELSTSFTAHVVEDEARREEEQGQVMTALEQRIAQWRAEIEDTRRSDMSDVAASMMDVGKRLMSLRQM